MEDIFVPIFLFAGITTIAVFFFYFSHRTRTRIQDTLQTAMEKGSVLTPELIRELGAVSNTRSTDLRRAILLVMLGIGILFYGQITDPGDWEFSGAALFPLLLGAGYFIVWKIDPDRVG